MVDNVLALSYVGSPDWSYCLKISTNKIYNLKNKGKHEMSKWSGHVKFSYVSSMNDCLDCDKIKGY